MPLDSSRWRHGLWVAGLVAVVWLACFRFPATWVATGIGEANRPFMDLYGILAARDAVRAGVNPYLPNDFDPYHRPHHYSDWWLARTDLGLGRADTLWLGTGLLAVFLLVAVMATRPRTPRQAAYLSLLLVSPAFLLAVNRTNNDLFVYLIVCLGLGCFRAARWPGQALAVILFAGAAVLKYTPLVTLVVLLDLRTRRGLLAGLALYGAVLALAWPGLQGGMSHLARFMPEPEGLYAFGAPMLARNLGFPAKAFWLVPGLLLGAWAAFSAARHLAEPARSVPERAGEREFMCGAAMLAGLFFMGSSYVYKLIFALWLLPWLWQLEEGGLADARWGRWTSGLLMALVWLEGVVAVVLNLFTGPAALADALHVLQAALVASQLLAWALVACLLRFLLIYVGRRAWALLCGPVPAGAGAG